MKKGKEDEIDGVDRGEVVVPAGSDARSAVRFDVMLSEGLHRVRLHHDVEPMPDVDRMTICGGA